MDGICTLANDRVCEQLIALLNSIEAMLGTNFPVCVYPYDNQVEKISEEIGRRPNVQLYDDETSIGRWDAFAREAWDIYYSTTRRKKNVREEGYHRFGTHRRYCAFDAPFEKFLYMDADTLLLNSTTLFFDKLNFYDCVVYDYQFKDISHVYEKNCKKLTRLFPLKRLNSEIFCSGVYASKRNLFGDSQRTWLLEKLRMGEAEILYPMAPDQTLLNYMMMRSSVPFYNFALHVDKDRRVGNCVKSAHFIEREHLLYDKGYRLNYLHYIGLSSNLFRRVCSGENIDFPYRDLFLHYRYLHEPEKKPIFTSPSQWYEPKSTLKQQMIDKVKQTIGVVRSALPFKK
jgi:hypothetical protein